MQVNKNLIRMAVNLIGKENIRTAVEQLFAFMLKEKESFELEEGETDIINIQYIKEEIPCNALATLDEKNQIKRVINVQSIDEMIDKHIMNL